MKNDKSSSPSHPHPYFSPGKLVTQGSKRRCKTLERDRELYPKISRKRYQIGSIAKSTHSFKQTYQNSLINTLSPHSKTIFEQPGEKQQVQNNLKSFVQNHEPYRSTTIIKYKPYFQLQVDNWENDFYYNLLDWSPRTNTIGIANRRLITLYNGNTISPLPQQFDQARTYFYVSDNTTVLKFSESKKLLAIGKINGSINIHDYEKEKTQLVFRDHESEISALDWNQHLISGCRRGDLIQRDDRTKISIIIAKLEEQICSVKQKNGLIAIGLDSHEVVIFDIRKEKIYDKYFHKAAVKALCWKPGTNKHLISGGGMKCKTVKFWSAADRVYNSCQTESQICNIFCSKTSQEFITTHGFGLKGMVKWSNFGKLLSVYEGHNDRLIYGAQSPDNGSIITGSPDGKVLFWKTFPKINPNSLEIQSDLR